MLARNDDCISLGVSWLYCWELYTNLSNRRKIISKDRQVHRKQNIDTKIHRVFEQDIVLLIIPSVMSIIALIALIALLAILIASSI